jgi:transcription-repair coupling factor (superfamily II helicase)
MSTTNHNLCSLAFSIRNLWLEGKVPYCIVCANDREAKLFYQNLLMLLPSEDVTYLPTWETLPYDNLSTTQTISSKRLAILHQLTQNRTFILVTSLSNCIKPTMTKEVLMQHALQCHTKQNLSLQSFSKQLATFNYLSVSKVQSPGEFAKRGSLLDVFPSGTPHAFRLDFFDDTLDSIRIIDPETQKSQRSLTEINLLPKHECLLASEQITHFRSCWRTLFGNEQQKHPIYQQVSKGHPFPGMEYYLPLFYPKPSYLFDFLPENFQLWLPKNLKQAYQYHEGNYNKRYQSCSVIEDRPLLPPEQFLLSEKKLIQLLKQRNTCKYTLESEEKPTNLTGCKIPLPAPISNQNDAELLHQWQLKYTRKLIIGCDSSGYQDYLQQQLDPNNVQIAATMEDALASDAQCLLTIASMSHPCWLDSSKTAIIPGFLLLGKKQAKKQTNQAKPNTFAQSIHSLAHLHEHDLVVHEDHGVGRFLGLTELTHNQQTQAYIMLGYAGDDSLYLPCNQINRISRYIGPKPESLDRLRSKSWQNKKAKAQKIIRETAHDLILTQAKRQAKKGYAFTYQQQKSLEFGQAFPYHETPDQLRAIDEIITDMKQAQPMDRLICGDVGFGKTEVAMRAAHLAAYNHKQIAILVPTTLLAEQHTHDFKSRFHNTPYRITCVSRLASSKECSDQLKQIKSGAVDIIIGTHRLLQPDIQFHDLGLIIIDEEHRFGVRHKEKLKLLKQNVDVLTLSATPIPRSLNMAVAKLRDLSLICTPPEQRESVKTVLAQNQPHVIQEAVARELERGGQVYYVYNDVASMPKKMEALKKLLPETISIGMGHGQMPKRQLDPIMQRFYHNQCNLLLTSTIIESGIDIANANTIIIERPEQFGLAQLHQLRGRVGRGNQQAYCYLLTADPKTLQPKTHNRLQRFIQHKSLGAGLRLAIEDLELRGAGELLGEQQSGHVSDIGLSLYLELLNQACDQINATKLPSTTLTPTPTDIELHQSAYIPESYLSDLAERMHLYQRIAMCLTTEALDALKIECIDRFGLLPTATQALFGERALIILATQAHIQKINRQSQKLSITFHPNAPPKITDKLINLLTTKQHDIALAGQDKISLSINPQADCHTQLHAFLHSITRVT